jgi:hypothetical protein
LAEKPSCSSQSPGALFLDRGRRQCPRQTALDRYWKGPKDGTPKGRQWFGSKEWIVITSEKTCLASLHDVPMIPLTRDNMERIYHDES